MFRLSVASLRAAARELSILVFHRVLPEPDPLFPDCRMRRGFARSVGWLHRWFNVLPLDEAIGRLAGGTLPERAAAITFDDGYADNFTVALPLLRERGSTATFFVATGFLDGGRMLNDTIIEAIRRCSRENLDLGSSRHRTAITRLRPHATGGRRSKS